MPRYDYLQCLVGRRLTRGRDQEEAMRFRSVLAVGFISLILAVMPVEEQQNNSPGLKMSPAEVAHALGVGGSPGGINPAGSSKMAAGDEAPVQAGITSSGLPVNMSSSSAFSTAVMTAVGGQS